MKMTSDWKIEYHNDVGPDDEGFSEWWTVGNGKRSFRCDQEDDAKALLDFILSGEHLMRVCAENGIGGEKPALLCL